jgi:probable F420-dependent oxidoreductase
VYASSTPGTLPRLGINLSALAPDQVLDATILAEELGYESAWIGEHVVSPRSWSASYLPSGSFEGPVPYLEPLVTLAHVAASTSIIRLGTGVIIGSLRDPFLTARACVSLDVLSGGRLDVGIGVGWLREEFEIMGKDFSTRGSRCDEFITVLDQLLSEETPEFHGRFYNFPPVEFSPKPVQSPRPRIHVAGHSDAALRRAATAGGGWISDALTPLEDLPPCLDALRRRLGEQHRNGTSFETTLMRLSRVGTRDLARAAEQGFDRVVVAPWAASDEPAKIGQRADLGRLREYADEVGLGPSALGRRGTG